MHKTSKTVTKKRSQDATTKAVGSVKLASLGVKSGRDFANLMSALMTDILTGNVSPQVANATCNAGGKLLKVIEMQIKYGHPTTATASDKQLLLSA